MASPSLNPTRLLSAAMLLLITAVTLPASADRRRAVRTPQLFPPCGIITGTSAVTFTRDEGMSLTPTATRLEGLTYTYGLAALTDNEERLLAWVGDDLLLSTDGGCSWRVEATVPGAGFPPSITAAAGGRAYIWADNRSFLLRFAARGVSKLKPPADVIGVGVDSSNGEHLRMAGSNGTVWDSTDGGESFTNIGSLTGAPLAYRFAFDPKDLDHLVAGTVSTGGWVSRDGGKNWTQATGFAARTANVFQLVFSPVDSDRVWAMGLDMDYTAEDPSHGRHIYVSDDGGATWRAVADESPMMKLVNGPVMAAHPTNADVLYFVYGSYFQEYGTDLFRFDLATKTLTMQHNPHHGVNAIAFSRRDPGVMYLGLERVEH